MTPKPKLILLVDDNPDDNFFHKRAIQKTGIPCNIMVCTSGDHALNYLTEQTPDDGEYPNPHFIFLDINMPRVNGWEFLKQYETWIEEKGHAPPPVVLIMLSTSQDPSDKERANASKLVSDYLHKPLLPQVFIDVVKKHFPAEFED